MYQIIEVSEKMAKLLDTIRHKMDRADYTKSTRESYVRWMREFIFYNGLKHPKALNETHVEGFLTYLATVRRVSGVTINQATVAILYLYESLGIAMSDKITIRAKTPRRRVPIIATVEHFQLFRQKLQSPQHQIMVALIFGAGLTPHECEQLTIDQVDFDGNAIKLPYRETILPGLLIAELREQVQTAEQWPGNVGRYLFPSSKIHGDRCWYSPISGLQKSMKRICRENDITQYITPKTLRNGFIYWLLDNGYDVRTVQEIAGYKTLNQVMAMKKMIDLRNVVSPLDRK